MISLCFCPVSPDHIPLQLFAYFFEALGWVLVQQFQDMPPIRASHGFADLPYAVQLKSDLFEIAKFRRQLPLSKHTDITPRFARALVVRKLHHQVVPIAAGCGFLVQFEYFVLGSICIFPVRGYHYVGYIYLAFVRYFFMYFKDVVAKLRFHNIRDSARLRIVGGIFEWQHHAHSSEQSQVTGICTR